MTRTRPKTLGEIEAEKAAAKAAKIKPIKSPKPPKPPKPVVEKKAIPSLRGKPKVISPEISTPVLPEITHHSKERNEVIQLAAAEAFAIPYVPPTYHIPQQGLSPEQELAARELCRRRLLPFIQRFRPKYLAGWVHADICRRFERFLRQVEAGEEPRLLLMMPPRSGKQMCDDTPVPTPQGLRFHGDLSPGDEVFHPSGQAIKVLAVSEKTPSNVKVTLSDGSEFYCHENHEWTLYNRMRGRWETIETNHFLKPTRFGGQKQIVSKSRSMYQLPAVAALEYRGTEFSMHPYVLGAWLGDGSAGKPCITGDKLDSAITAKIASLGYPVSTVCTHNTTGVLTTYFSGTPVTDWPGRMTRELQQLEIYTSKRIPLSYQTLTAQLRLELLAGLIDTDGTTDENSRISITTVSRELADDIVQLCEGLGFRPYLQEVQPTLSSSGIQGRRVCYAVGFQPTCDIPVALERKRVTRIAQQRRIGLVSVERVESGRFGHCIEVDSPDGLYVIGTKPTATHNSEISSRHYAAWVLGQHPDWEIIAASHTGSLTMSFSRYLRDLIRDPAYSAVFPDAVLDPSSQSVENWNLTKGGGYLAAGVGTGITGRGAHILLLDDLVKDIEAADSITIRDNTWEWYISTAYTRLAPGGGVLGLMTWWHDDDWAGRIQNAMAAGEGDQFEVVRYPAINEKGDEYLLADDTIVEIPLGFTIPDGARRTRKHNTAIHPERYSTEAMLRIKRNAIAGGMKRTWDALYQQNPIPDEGNYFSKEMFRFYSTPPARNEMYVYQAWDFAITTDKTSDYTVCSTVGVDHRDSQYVLDVRRFKTSDGIQLAEMMVDMALQWGAESIGVEDGQIWKAIETQFLRACEEKRHFPAFEVLKPLTDKMVRANPLKGRMQAGKVYFDKNAHWWTDLQKEMLHFPAGKHDDQIDSLAWVTRLILTRSAPRDKRLEPKLKSWKDDLTRFLENGGGSHMAA